MVRFEIGRDAPSMVYMILWISVHFFQVESRLLFCGFV